MDSDDPFDWSLQRVVREFCTDNRTWIPPPGSVFVMPDTNEFEEQLALYEIDGTSLLLIVDDKFLKEEMRIDQARFKLAHKMRYTIMHAITQFKRRSSKYKANMQKQTPGNSQDLRTGNGDEDTENLLLPAAEPVDHAFIDSSDEMQVNNASAVMVPQEQHDSMGEALPYHENPTLKATQAVAPDISVDEGLMSDSELNALLDGESAQSAMETSVPASANDPLQECIKADSQEKAGQDRPLNAEPPVAIPIIETQAPQEKKKVRRLAPTFVSKDLPQGIVRELATEADDVIFHLPDRLAPKAVVRNEDGKKRLAPNWVSLTPSGSVMPDGIANLESAKELQAAVAARQTRAKADLSKGYLGSIEMPVDDIFFSDTAMGASVEQPDSDDDFARCGEDISSGRRLYVAKRMKHFMMSQTQLVKRGTRHFVARRPYPEELVPKTKSTSFILAQRSDTGDVVLTRENVAQWPELEPGHPKTFSIDSEHQATFNLPDGEFPLGGPSSYDDWDPEKALRKWQHLPDDAVLPVFGESDEENEYDLDTWNEMEAEFGHKDQPVVAISRRPLSEAEVHEAMDEGMAMIQARWEDIHRPKIERQAFGVWMAPRKDPMQKRQRIRQRIRQQQEKLDHLLQSRIPGIREEILKQVWTTKRQVHHQCQIMERSIFDREEILWEINLLKQKTPPEKPPPLPKKEKRPPTSRLANDALKGGDSESIGTSSDEEEAEDELEDFIIPDAAVAGEDLDMTDESTADSESQSESDASEDESPPLTALKDDSDLDTPMVDIADIADADDEEKDDVKVRTHRRRPRFPSSKQITSIDLTVDTPPSADRFSRREGEVVDLLTPVKKRGMENSSPSLSEFRQSLNSSSAAHPRNRETISLSDSDSENELPLLHEWDVIVEFGMEHWCKRKDHDRMLVTKIANMVQPAREQIIGYFDAMAEVAHDKDALNVVGEGDDDIWKDMMSVLKANSNGQESVRGLAGNQYQIVTGIIRLFQMWTDGQDYPKRTHFDKYIYAKLKDKQATVSGFLDICRNTLDQFRTVVAGDEFTPPGRPKVRVRPVFQDAKAQKARTANEQKVAEQDIRRKALRKLLATAPMTGVKAKLVINESKLESEGIISVHSEIGDRIKEHQMDGIRFMWGQIVSRVGDEELQGCLLAHTMGLGKTMQAITLLVAITEAANSEDPTVNCQIPDHLRISKTLILCPPGLLDNWMDELLMWVPEDVLPKIGRFRKVESALKSAERLAEIDAWHETGGILLLGYQMFTTIISSADGQTEDDDNPSSDGLDYEKARNQLLKGPNIVIADEAHRLKNANSKLHQAAKQFRTQSRIALTGSPLSNNVAEYHSMVDWVAPNYLGPIVEFRANYVEPIEAGLYLNSSGGERRTMKKKLAVLSQIIAPKVNRCGSDVLKGDLPPKTEFIIQVPLTSLQEKLYNLYVDNNLKAELTPDQLTKEGMVKQTTLWSWLNMLALLCNHPVCFRDWYSMTDKQKKEAVDPSAELEPLPKLAGDNSLKEEVRAIMPQYDESKNGLKDSYKMMLLSDILDAARETKDKVLVFSQSIPTIEFMQRMFDRQNRKYAVLTGKTVISGRQGAVKDFNNGDREVFLISTTAGGIGLNLHGANRVVIVDSRWNPAHEEQAIGRVYRLGQTKHVFVYRLVVSGTYEEKMHNQTVFKTQLASQVVDKKNILANAKREKTRYLFHPRPVAQSDLSEFIGKDPEVLDRVLAFPQGRTAVRGIQMTEAFNRPDNETLTAEEDAQVQLELADEKLKREDPRAWHAKKAATEEAKGAAYNLLFAREHAKGITQPGMGQNNVNNGRPAPPSTAPPSIGTVQQRISTIMNSSPRPSSQTPRAQVPIMGSGTRMASPDADPLMENSDSIPRAMAKPTSDRIREFEEALSAALREVAKRPDEAESAPERAAAFIQYIMQKRPNEDYLLVQRIDTACVAFRKYISLANDFLAGRMHVKDAINEVLDCLLDGPAPLDPNTYVPDIEPQNKRAQSSTINDKFKMAVQNQLALTLEKSLTKAMDVSSSKMEISRGKVVGLAGEAVQDIEKLVTRRLIKDDNADKDRTLAAFARASDFINLKIRDDIGICTQWIDDGLNVRKFVKSLIKEFAKTPHALDALSPRSKKSMNNKIMQPGNSTPTRPSSVGTSAQNSSRSRPIDSTQLDGSASGTDSVRSKTRILPPSKATHNSQHTPLSAPSLVKNISGVKKPMAWGNRKCSRPGQETPVPVPQRPQHVPSGKPSSKHLPRHGGLDEPAKTQSPRTSSNDLDSPVFAIHNNDDEPQAVPVLGGRPVVRERTRRPYSSRLIVEPKTSNPPFPSTEAELEPAQAAFFFDPPLRSSRESQLKRPAPDTAGEEPRLNGASHNRSSTSLGGKRFNWAPASREQTPAAEGESSTVSGTPTSTASAGSGIYPKKKKQKTSRSDSGGGTSVLPKWAERQVASSQSTPIRRARGGSVRSNRSGGSTPAPSTQP